MKRLAIITTHPIQYYAPVFKLLHQRQKVNINVFYTWGGNSVNKYDPGFNKKIEWDIPLLDGYPYEWAKNTAKDQGSHHFNGIITPDLIEQIKAWRPDALLIYGWGFNSHLKVIRHFKNKIPVFFRGDSTLLDEKKGIRSFLKTTFLRGVYRNVNSAFYVGANNKAYFKSYGLKEHQLKFAPHAIDNERFSISFEQQAASIRSGLSIASDELIIMFAGKLEEKKSPLLLLEAFVNLKQPGVHLLFIGNGPLEQPLKLNAKDHPDVHFMDFQNQSQLPAFYQACDIFCIPSSGPGETWGLAINEAMASGKAILASDKVGAAADLVKPGYNGEIFTAGSRDDLILKLDLLIIKGKSELKLMGEKSKTMIKKWSFEKQVEAIEATVNEE